MTGQEYTVHGNEEEEFIVEKKDNFSNFLLGLGLGIGIGMLFAPKSGQETRELLKSKAGESKEFLKQRSAEIREQANEFIEKSREAVGRQKEHLAEAMRAGQQAYRDTVGQEPPPPPPAEGPLPS